VLATELALKDGAHDGSGPGIRWTTIGAVIGVAAVAAVVS
jgi:hypothetical protein